jgi:predicted nuclease with TOPRIM domain
MAKSHYSVKKRKKELARKLKQEQKRQRKLDKDKKEFEGDLNQSQDEIENLQVQGGDKGG